MKLCKLFLGSSALALALGCGAGSALSQENIQATAESAAPSAVVTDEEARLQSVVVTAQRRSQGLQDVPVAVSAATGERLEQANITNAVDLEALVPALKVFSTSNGVQPFLRGIGTPGSLAGNESSVAVYLDDVYLTRVSPALLELSSVERLEVLKGPQGTLFGRNASGGLLHIVTREPQEDPAFEGSVGYGRFDTFRTKFYATTGLADGVAIDFAGLYTRQSEGWGTNIATGQDWGRGETLAFRSKLRWDIAPGTVFTLTGDYTEADNDFLAISQYEFGAPRGYSLPPYGLVPPRGFYDIEANDHPKNTEESWGISGKIEHDIGFANFVSITAYREQKNFLLFDSDFTSQNLLRADLWGFSEQFSQELQLTSNGASSIDWIAGLFYLNSSAGYEPSRFTGLAIDAAGPLLMLPPGTAVASDVYGNNQNDSYAAYGQVTLPVGESTGVTLGARYTVDEIVGEGRSDLYPVGAPPFTLAAVKDEETFKKFTYKASINHNFTPDFMVYLSQSRGYKSGLYNTLPLSSPPAKPEILDATELGLKSELFGNRLRLNGAAFYYDFKDAQFQQFDGPTVTIINANEARIYGVEFEGEAQLSRDLNLRFGAAYLDSKYTDFDNAQSPVPNPNTDPALGPVGGYLDGFLPYDASGNDMARVPVWTANLGANYQVNSSAGGFNFDVNYSYSSSFFWDADNVLKQPEYSLIGARVKYTPPGAEDRFSVSLWGKNLTNEKYYVAQVQGDGARGSSAMPGAPMTYGVDFSFKF